MASAMPMSSADAPPCSMTCIAGPDTSTVRPASRAVSMRSRTSSCISGVTSSCEGSSKVKEIVPMRPSSDSGVAEAIWATAAASAATRSNGWPAAVAWDSASSMLAVTWASRPAAPSTGLTTSSTTVSSEPRSVTRVFTASAYGSSASVSPSGAATTIVADGASTAAESGNSSCWSSAVSTDSTPGIEKVFDIGLDSSPAPAPRVTRAMTHAARKIGQRR